MAAINRTAGRLYWRRKWNRDKVGSLQNNDSSADLPPIALHFSAQCFFVVIDYSSAFAELLTAASPRNWINYILPRCNSSRRVLYFAKSSRTKASSLSTEISWKLNGSRDAAFINGSANWRTEIQRWFATSGRSMEPMKLISTSFFGVSSVQSRVHFIRVSYSFCCRQFVRTLGTSCSLSVYIYFEDWRLINKILLRISGITRWYVRNCNKTV